MRIKKGKMSITLLEDNKSLYEQYAELRRLALEIKNSPEFMTLLGKTQLVEIDIFKGKGRSRGQHSINVAMISERIVGSIYDELKSETLDNLAKRKSKLQESQNEGNIDRRLKSIERAEETIIRYYDINKAIAVLYAYIVGLSHDLGHTPFGHSGERAINEFLMSVKNPNERQKILEKRREYFGEEYELAQGHDENYKGAFSFEHNEQSAIIFQKIAKRVNVDITLVDISRIVQGILSHSRSRVKVIPEDLVAQVVRQADKICYINYDYQELKDGIDFSKFDWTRKAREYSKRSLTERIRQAEDGIVSDAIQEGVIFDNGATMKSLSEFRKKFSEIVIEQTDEDGRSSLIKGDNRERQELIVRKLTNYFFENQLEIPDDYFANICGVNNENLDMQGIIFSKDEWEGHSRAQVALSFVASLTNTECMKLYYELVSKRINEGKGHGIEPITRQDIQNELQKSKNREYEIAMLKERLTTMKEGTRRTESEMDETVKLKIECRRNENNNLLTEEGKRAIEETKRIIREVEKEDEDLYNSMIKSDIKREGNVIGEI